MTQRNKNKTVTLHNIFYRPGALEIGDNLSRSTKCTEMGNQHGLAKGQEIGSSSMFSMAGKGQTVEIPENAVDTSLPAVGLNQPSKQAIPAQNIPPDAEESLADWERERDRIQNERDAEEQFWAAQEQLQRETDDK